MKEITPKEMTNYMPIFFGSFYLLGIDFPIIVYIILEQWSLELYYKAISFFIPAIISLTQLILINFVYIYDTPRMLCENKMEEEAITEMKKIYPSNERRIAEYRALMESVNNDKNSYPTYAELFTRQNFYKVAIGSAMLAFRNSSEYYMLTVLNDVELKNWYFVSAYICMALGKFCTPFLMSHCIINVINSRWQKEVYYYRGSNFNTCGYSGYSYNHLLL